VRLFNLRRVAVLLLSCAAGMPAQDNQSSQVTSVPRLVRINDTFHPANGLPAARVESVTLSIYKDQEGGSPLWQETQNVTLDSENRYAALMGSTLNDGVPVDLFSSGEPRWLGVRFNRPGESEQPRTQMASVPYALKASDAETLGGLPASAYLRDPAATLAGTAIGSGSGISAPAGSTNAVSGKSLKPRATSGISNYLGVFTNATDLGSSVMYQSGAQIGLNTAAPFDFMHVRFTDPVGQFTGYAVQNLGNSATSYSGMLFFDQNNALGQFQGFNNGTHEYRINNIAAGGTINFMVGGVSRFFVGNNGNIGVGTSTPNFKLDVAGQINGNNAATLGFAPAVRGIVNNPNSPAITGTNLDTSAPGSGIFPVGVGGNVNGPTGAGVQGNASQVGAVGVGGFNSATTGFAVGVQGGTNSTNGSGVNGFNNAVSGFAVGVTGGSNSPNGAGVYGFNTVTSSGFPAGVQGNINGTFGAGVVGNAQLAGAAGVNGFNNASTGYAVGVQGGTNSTNGAGVQGNASHAGASGVNGFNSATSGYSVGVSGGTASTNGAGVSGNSNVAGVFGTVGFNGATSGNAIGTEGASSSPGGSGLWGVSMACSSGCNYVAGTAGLFQAATTGTLLKGISGTSGTSIGTSATVFTVDGSGNGMFAGNLNVTGTITGAVKNFKIDDPIDPGHKYLYHASIESSEMANLYTGNVVLDRKGEAVVALPEWFEALNGDFRYQLTTIGKPAPVYIAKEIQNHQFKIAGGRAGIKVSWTVTGIRHDAWAQAHPMQVEEPKAQQ
jgi:hypothetical protein